MLLRPLNSIFDALSVRKIRNECCEFMTRDKSHIPVLRQIDWYFRVYRPEFSRGECCALLGEIEEREVAYGYIRQMQSIPLISGGLAQQARGKGFGLKLFEELTNYAFRCGADRAQLEVLETNIVALHVYSNLGFVESGRVDRVIRMHIFRTTWLERIAAYRVNDR